MWPKAMIVSKMSQAFGALLPGVALALAVILVSCKGSASPSPVPESLDPKAILKKASESMKGLSGLHFKLEDNGKGTPVLPGLLMTSAEGDMAGKGRARAILRLSRSGLTGFLEMEVRTMGTLSYVSDPVTRQWSAVPTLVLPLDFTDLGPKLGQLLEDVEGPSYIAAEDVGGRLTYHLRVRVSSKGLRTIVYNAAKDSILDVDLWIDRESFLIREAVIAGALLPEDGGDASRHLRLSRFGETVNVEAPKELPNP